LLSLKRLIRVFIFFSDSSYYDDGLTAYASTQRSGMMTDSLIDPQMLTSMDVTKMNHSFEDEPEYGASHGDKVIKEIIV
jgi:hypothetical protein